MMRYKRQWHIQYGAVSGMEMIKGYQQLQDAGFQLGSWTVGDVSEGAPAGVVKDGSGSRRLKYK